MIVAIIGTGTMGPSIAQVFSQCEKVDKVLLCKGRITSKKTGYEEIKKSFDRLIGRKKIDEEYAEECLNRIEFGNLDIAKQADLVIEAIAEELEVKKQVFSKLDKICDDGTIFATNTSSIPIIDLDEGLTRPIIGMHFFNPAPVMKLVEIITSDRIPQNIIDEVFDITRWIGKTPIEVKEAPGFVVNRVLIPMINEAIGIYSEGVASMEDIDVAMKLGANHPMGPLELGDLIGLDVVLSILNVMLKETGDSRYLPQPLLKRMVRENKLGRKTGEGFYKY